MSNDAAIRVSHVFKSFKLPHENHSSIKNSLLHFAKRKRGYEKQDVLDDIDFEVKRGEFFGIVGRNGSGKSTLLKLLAQIYTPNKGSIEVHGNLTPFIELGVGFNPELTGRENVFMNGALLGFNRKDMLQMYDDIVTFAELEKFMDQKLKNYSSGMQVRLAFSIAIRAESDILLVDEVLAVGDSNFQRKCFEVFETIKQSGRTVVFVTHDMGAVQKYCDRAIMIKKGKIVSEGDPRKVALTYEMENLEAQKNEGSDVGVMQRPSNPLVKLTKIHLQKPKSSTGKANSFLLDDPIKIGLHYTAREACKLSFGFNISRHDDGMYMAGYSTKEDLGPVKAAKGKGVISCTIDPGQLAAGAYHVNGTIFNYEDSSVIDFMDIHLGTLTPEFYVIEAKPFKDGLFNIKGAWRKEL